MVGDSGLRLGLPAGEQWSPREGHLSNFWVVWYGLPCQPQAGVTIAYVGQEAPHRFSGYSAITPIVGDPHTPSH